MNIIFSSAEQALIFTPLVLGMYLSYRIIRVTDLTVDGTYVLGAAVFARTIEFGLFPALICSTCAGAIIGFIVACMQRNNIVSDLIVGVLASFMLYSVNLQILGRPNISLLDVSTLLSFGALSSWIIILAVIAGLIVLGLFFLLTSKLGLVLRAFGYNQKLLKVLGKSPENYRLLALSLSNSLAAFSGVLAAQVNGFADINMGIGVALVGIGAVVIGRQLIIGNSEKFVALKELSACFIGILLYFVCLNCLLKIGINPVNLKLVLGMVLFFALSRVYKRGKV